MRYYQRLVPYIITWWYKYGQYRSHICRRAAGVNECLQECLKLGCILLCIISQHPGSGWLGGKEGERYMGRGGVQRVLYGPGEEEERGCHNLLPSSCPSPAHLVTVNQAADALSEKPGRLSTRQTRHKKYSIGVSGKLIKYASPASD